jgi:hypothetical protein
VGVEDSCERKALQRWPAVPRRRRGTGYGPATGHCGWADPGWQPRSVDQPLDVSSRSCAQAPEASTAGCRHAPWAWWQPALGAEGPEDKTAQVWKGAVVRGAEATLVPPIATAETTRGSSANSRLEAAAQLGKLRAHHHVSPGPV